MTTATNTEPKIIYIIGKYRDSNTNKIAENIWKATQASTKLWREKWIVICPHLNTAHFEIFASDIPDSVWMKGDLEIIKMVAGSHFKRKAVYILDNWMESEGSKEEIKLAEELGLERIYEG